jgi:ribosomal protein S18 acetylase RimI-like enzyme
VIKQAESLIKRVINYFSSKGSPFACFRISSLTQPKSFPYLLEQCGFQKKLEYEESVMVFKGRPLKDKLNPVVEIEEIEGEIDLFSEILITIFEMPVEWKKVIEEVILEFKRKGAKHYLGYVEGKPVGTISLASLMKTGNIFNVGTLREYRNRGIGTTLTLHAVMDSINIGNDLHTLQTEKGGNAERLYGKMGFEIDHTTSYFVKNLQDRK